MARIQTTEVQAWLSDGRIVVDDGDLSEQIEEYVLSRVEGTYDTSAWIDKDTTPDLVRQVIAILTAGLILRKAYSDQDDIIPYADKLEIMGEARLVQIEEGKLTLTIGAIVIQGSTASAAAGPVFFPTETERLDSDSPHKIVFEMGTVF